MIAGQIQNPIFLPRRTEINGNGLIAVDGFFIEIDRPKVIKSNQPTIGFHVPILLLLFILGVV